MACITTTLQVKKPEGRSKIRAPPRAKGREHNASIGSAVSCLPLLLLSNGYVSFLSPDANAS